jgi:hypothetical protein
MSAEAVSGRKVRVDIRLLRQKVRSIVAPGGVVNETAMLVRPDAYRCSKKGPKRMADAESLELFSACLASRRFMRSDYVIRASADQRQSREYRIRLRELLYFCRPPQPCSRRSMEESRAQIFGSEATQPLGLSLGFASCTTLNFRFDSTFPSPISVLACHGS